MFLIDDLLLMPARGMMAVFREVHNAAQQDAANESESLRTELSELYMLLETEQVTEAEFDRREKELLDRLDEIETRQAEPADPTDDKASEDGWGDEFEMGDRDLEIEPFPDDAAEHHELDAHEINGDVGGRSLERAWTPGTPAGGGL